MIISNQKKYTQTLIWVYFLLLFSQKIKLLSKKICYFGDSLLNFKKDRGYLYVRNGVEVYIPKWSCITQDSFLRIYLHKIALMSENNIE